MALGAPHGRLGSYPHRSATGRSGGHPNLEGRAVRCLLVAAAVVAGCEAFASLNWIALVGVCVVGAAYALTNDDRHE